MMAKLRGGFPDGRKASDPAREGERRETDAGQLWVIRNGMGE